MHCDPYEDCLSKDQSKIPNDAIFLSAYKDTKHNKIKVTEAIQNQLVLVRAARKIFGFLPSFPTHADHFTLFSM